MKYLIRSFAAWTIRSLLIRVFQLFGPLIFFAESVNAQASFVAPDTVCITTPVSITNTSPASSSYFWNFCQASLNQVPTGVNLGNPGNEFNTPVFMDFVSVNNNFYGFVTNHYSGNLVRLDFGNNLLNNPAVVNLGNFGGQIEAQTEGIQVVFNEGRWYAIIVAGNTLVGTTPSIMKVDFGPDITNLNPTVTNWGNIGNLFQPIDLHVFEDNGHWYGLTINAENNTITRFDFTTSFNNVPTGTNLGNIGGLNYPTGIYALNDDGLWKVFIVNGGRDGTGGSALSSLTRLDFGSSLLNTPVGTNLGNPNNMLKHPRDITIIKICGDVFGFAVNGGLNSEDLIKMDFVGGTAAAPQASSLGNLANFALPHSISRIFRVGAELFAFITNARNHTLSRLRFAGCNNASVPNSTALQPPSIVYNQPGVYNINLTIDDGLPTQSSVCKPVVVQPAMVHYPLRTLSICQGDSVKIGVSEINGAHIWNNGTTVDSAYVKTAGYYWVETTRYGCVNRDSFLVNVNAKPQVALGNDVTICKFDTVRLNAGNTGFAYLWNTGSTSAMIDVFDPGTYSVVAGQNGCLAYDTIVVQMYPVPVYTTSADVTICQNSSTQLYATGGQAYTWSPSSSLNSSDISNPLASPSANTRYYVTIYDENACDYLDSVDVAVIPLPNLEAQTAFQICEEESVSLNASGGDTYLWQPSTGLSDPRVSNPVASPLVTTDYSVTITESVCNTSLTLPVHVRVVSLPVVSATSSNDLDCSTDQSRLLASGAVRYTWAPATSLSNSQVSNPIATPLVTTKYVVTGTNEEGCRNYDSVIVKVTNINKAGYLMPNAFTPNGDGKNDCYGIRYWGGISNVEFSIFNRWGERVFFTRNPSQCWDGTYKGVMQAGNVFVYMVKAVTLCEPLVFRKGTFLLIR
jgi:gliding motility-associated-like protein